MPIRPENKARYPKDWKKISAAVRERAGNKCEGCGAPNGEVVYRDRTGWHIVGYDRKGDYEDVGNGFAAKCVEIVLTTAHLNHTPEDCASSNLKALCQKCHNAYDAPVRAAGIKARRKALCAAGDLFNGDGDTDTVRNLPGRPVEQQADGAPDLALCGGVRQDDRESVGRTGGPDAGTAG